MDQFGLYQQAAATCVASYVREAIKDPERRAQIREKLKKGLPDVTTSYGVMAIVDLSGYSKLTSELTKIGKIGSEVISKTVSDYLDEVILVISRFRGDVVKFLGDAILVCFSKCEETEEETMHRAYLCCLYISTQLCSVTIDLDLAIQENNRFGDDESQVSGNGQQVAFQTSVLRDSKTVTLFIHVAMAAGEVSHCIIGDPDVRMDYCLNGDCLHQLGDILDATKSGELGMTAAIYENVAPKSSEATSDQSIIKQDNTTIISAEALTQLYLESESKIAKLLNIEEEITANEEQFEITTEEFSMLEIFVNQALLKKLRHGHEVRKPTISRLSKTVRRGSSTIAVKSQFRVISIVFVKLLSPFSPQKAQVAMSSFVAILKQYEGIFQQYSVDDKGQTMLACFGLPPWTHEKDPLNAIKAALDFEDFCLRNKSVGNVSISIATGELLFSLLGSGERKEVSLLGDVVNLAARLLCLPISNAIVKLDKLTYDVTKQDVTPTSLGLFKVKGKMEPVEVWTVAKKKIVAESSADMFGYITEKEFIKTAVYQWYNSGISQKMIVEGPSGIGKSKLLDFLCQEVVDHIILNGLGPRDVESILKQKFAEPAIKVISEQICQVVLDKSNKLPLYIDLIAESLKAQLYDIFMVESNGQLLFKGSDGESRIAALSTISSSVLTQFDRLDPAFQSLLLKASILGQYFILEDLCYFLPGKSRSVEDLQRLIEQHDKYHYLIKQEQDESGEHPWFFRHIQIMQALYNSQSFAERSATHLQAAEYYEGALELSTNRDFILPIVAYHYRKTSDIQKQITYLEELGIQNYRKSHSTSMSYLEALLEIVSQNEDTVKVENERKAQWLAFLAVQKVNAAVYTAEQYERAILSLRLAGTDWPEDPSQVGKSIISCGISLYRLWKDTKGGTRPLPERTDCLGRRKMITYYKVPSSDIVAEAMNQAYRTLFRLGVFSMLLDSKTKLLVMLSQVSVNMILGWKSKGVWAGILYYASFGLSWSLVPVSRAYWKQAEKIEQSIKNGSDRELLEGFYQYRGFNLLQSGRLKEACDAFVIAHEYCGKRGDLSNQIIINCFHLLACVHQGDAISYDERSIAYSKERTTYQISQLYYLTFRKMVTTDFQGTQAYHQRAKDTMKTFPPQPTMDRILEVNEAWILLQHGDVALAIDFIDSACTGLSTLRHVFCELFSVAYSIGIMTWMLARPCIPDYSTGKQELADKHRARILLCLEKIMMTTSFFAVQNKMRVYWIAHIILKASKLYLQKKKKKALTLLLKELKTSRCITIMKELQFPKAIVYSILGIHLQNEADRQYYLRQARQAYQEFGFTYLEKWLAWNEAHH
ncbi:Adenylate cyclase type 10 [Chytridiales sp. JEL 0842]|nr:Adenylate cyclase type 10 [Chytridiales sp. JEL 0842]